MDSLILSSQLAFDLSIPSPHSHSPCLHILFKCGDTTLNKSLKKTTLNKTLASLLISSASICQGLSWMRLSLLGSLLFSLEPKKAEEGTAMTIYNFSAVLWYENSEIQAGEPLSPFLCNLHGPVCWLIVIQAKFVPTNFWRSWRERQDCVLHSWKAKIAPPKCSFLTSCAFQLPKPWNTEAKISDFGEVRKFCQQKHRKQSH